MSLSLVILLAFAALVAVFTAVALTVRDLCFRPAGAGTESPSPPSLPLLEVRHRQRPPHGVVEQLDRRFAETVAESGTALEAMTAALLLTAVALLAGGFAFLAADNILLGVIAAIAALGIGWGVLVIRRRRHLAKLRDQLPDVIDLIARAVRAGESLEQATELVGTKGPEPLATEFRRVSRHLRLGLALPAAMRAMAGRIPLLEARIFTTTLSVHRQTGGNLPSTLERMAAVIRERLAYRRQLKATTAAGRFSAMMVATIGPLLFGYMFIFQPEYSHKLLELPLGQMLLGVAVALEFVGLIWVARMLKPEL